MVHNGPPLSLLPADTPPDSPRPWTVTTLSDDQAIEMASAIAALRMAPTAPSSTSPSCQILSKDPPPSSASKSTPTAQYPPTPCHTFPTNHLLSQDVVELAQQFMEILKSINSQNSSASAGPHASTTESSNTEKPRERASRLEVKSVVEAYATLPN